MALFFHSIASNAMATCVCASLIFTSCKDVPSLVYVDPKYLLELVHLFQRFSSHQYVIRQYWLNAVDDNVAFVGADFHAVASSFLQSFYDFLWCSKSFSTNSLQLNICSVVGSSVIWNLPVPFHARFTALLRITRSMTLLGWLIRLIVLQFWQSRLLPFSEEEWSVTVSSSWAIHCPLVQIFSSL